MSPIAPKTENHYADSRPSRAAFFRIFLSASWLSFATVPSVTINSGFAIISMPCFQLILYSICFAVFFAHIVFSLRRVMAAAASPAPQGFGQGIVSTLAGSGLSGFADAAKGLSAQFNSPSVLLRLFSFLFLCLQVIVFVSPSHVLLR